MGLSESDSKLYTNFESCEKNKKSFEIHVDLQSQVIKFTESFSRKVHIF